VYAFIAMEKGLTGSGVFIETQMFGVT